MRVVVNLDLCQGHSQCEQVAPELFAVRDGANGYQCSVLEESPDPALVAKARDAVRRCPTEALSITE